MKTNYIKNILSPRLLAVVLFLSASFSAFGQELIRETAGSYYMCDTSIIRVTSTDSVIICNREQYRSIFMLVYPGSAPTPVLYLDSLFVNDFEILNDVVYFCGFLSDGYGRKAVFGRFNYSVFCDPSQTYFSDTNITIYEFDTCTEFKKLDLFRFSEFGTTETHLIMTGTTGIRPNVLAEACYISNSSLSFRAYFSNDETESLDDVAVLTDYVIVSTRLEDGGIPLVVFRRYPRATMIGQTIFSAPIINTLLVPSPAASTPIYLEHKKPFLHDYAAVYKVSVFSRIAMLELSAVSSNIKAVEIFGDETETIHPTEIKYNKHSDVYDILARNEMSKVDTTFLSPMQIYHITPGVLNNQTSLGDGTRYRYNNIYCRVWSIDVLNSSNYFIASGDSGRFPRLYRYTHNEWKNCPERFEYRFDTGIPKGTVRQYVMTSKKYTPEQRSKHVRRWKVYFPSICGQLTKNAD